MQDAKKNIDEPMYERNRGKPLYFKVTYDEEARKNFGLFL